MRDNLVRDDLSRLAKEVLNDVSQNDFSDSAYAKLNLMFRKMFGISTLKKIKFREFECGHYKYQDFFINDQGVIHCHRIGTQEFNREVIWFNVVPHMILYHVMSEIAEKRIAINDNEFEIEF